MKTTIALAFASSLITAGCAAPVDGEILDEGTVDAEQPAAPEYPRFAMRGFRVIVDSEAPDALVGETRGALEKWQRALRDDCPIAFVIERGATSPVTFDAPEYPKLGTIELRTDRVLPSPEMTGYTAYFSRWDVPQGSRITLKVGAPVGDRPRAILHELGHAFRLDHDETEPNVMQGSGRFGDLEDPTDLDVRHFAAVWCPVGGQKFAPAK